MDVSHTPVAIAQEKPRAERNPMHDASSSYPAPPWASTDLYTFDTGRYRTWRA
jgi:hypothetical protein